MKVLIALLLLAGCTRGIREQQRAWIVPYAHYSITKLPEGPLTSPRWQSMGSGGEADFWFRENSPYSTLLAVHGIELSEAARRKPLLDLAKDSSPDLLVVAMHFAKLDFARDLTFTSVEEPHPFAVESGEAAELSLKFQKEPYRFEFVFIRSPDRQRAVVVFYGNDDRWYGEGIEDARSLARRIQFIPVGATSI